MASPFPGMDPYLEGDLQVFTDFQFAFVVYLSEALQLALPNPYTARIGRRTQESGDDDPVVQRFVQVGCPRSKFATAIEVLSPTNKTEGEYGRNLYIKKQQEIVKHSQVNLIEIDLLRGGRHATAVPLQRLKDSVRPFDYHICVHRFAEPDRFFLHALILEEALPTIDVPLLPEDGAVQVDLQAVFARTYDAGPYRREIVYGRDPVVPPLSDEKAGWAAQLING